MQDEYSEVYLVRDFHKQRLKHLYVFMAERYCCFTVGYLHLEQVAKC